MWVAVGVAVVGGVASYASSKSASNAAEQANQNAIDANRWQGEIAQEQWQEYKNTYQPLERSVVAEAQNFDSPEAYALAAGKAQATNSEAFGKARERLGRTAGLDPSSGAFQASMVGLDQSQAATDAVSQNAARAGIRDQAWARRMEALGLGKGLVTGASSGFNAASTGAQAIAARQGANASNTAAATGQFIGNVGSQIMGSQGFKSWVNGSNGTGVNPYEGYNAAANGGWGIE